MSASDRALFAGLSELPLTPPPHFRSYGPLADDPDPIDLRLDTETSRGLAFAIEYCDSRGWISMRTIRCQAASADHPGYLQAWCAVRRTTRVFRLDRIISITHLRTGRLLDGCGHRMILDAILGRTPRAGIDAEPIVGTERDGSALLLALAGAAGGDAERAVVADYIAAERAARGAAVPSAQAVALWVEHFVPDSHFVREAEERLFRDRDALVRLLPWTLKLASAGTPIDPGQETVLRDLMEMVRHRYGQSRTQQAPQVVALR